MPVITGSRGGGSTSPYLTLQWDVIETDIANNRSKVRLILKLVADYNLRFSANKSGVLQGSSFTYTSGANGTGSWTLRTTEVWVGHNSDGTKTQNFSGSFNLAVTYSGTWIGNMTVSGNATLPAIPRQSLLNSASITNLKTSTSATLSIGRTVYHNGFYHLVTIQDGNTWIWDTGYFSGAPAESYTIPSSYVNKMLNRMPTSTSKTMTVRLATYTGSGGSGLIGTQVRNLSVGVDGTVKPTASSLSISQQGNSVSSHYLQSISRVKAEFSASAGHGATISTRTIIVRKTDGSNAQTMSGASGTTTNPIASTGSYEVVATARDSRGRTSNVARTTFTATAYNQPRISKFTVTRQANAQTVVDISRAGTWTSLGGLNVLNISVERRQGSGSWASIETATGTATAGTFSRDFTQSGNSVSLSYDYRLVISDKFGNSADSMASVSTQRVVLDIHKNEGVGIGKIREKGVLDVDGSAYFRGNIVVDGADPNTLRFNAITQKDDGYISWYDNNNNRKGWMGFGSGLNNHMSMLNDTGDDIQLMATNGGKVVIGDGNNNREIASRGSNTNGHWVRFYDGTQICWITDAQLKQTKGGWRIDGSWTFPQRFYGKSAVTITIYNPAHQHVEKSTITTPSIVEASVEIALRIMDGNVPANTIQPYGAMAVGRWYA